MPDAPADDAPPRQVATTVTIQRARTIIARNDSPDIPFTQSINPYQGCEHGCIYCYARPTHAYLDLSPGLEFETKLFAKPDARALLRAELGKPGYRCDPIALGSNTDPYQPIEREWKVTRSILEVLAEHEHPFSIVTKSALVERDIDLIAPMAAKNMARVYFSVTTLDRDLARMLEPRAAAPERRLAAMRALHDAGIPVGVLVAPVIPQLNDRHLEAILEAAAQAGAATAAGWIMLRLPLEIAPLFRAWLDEHFPLRAAHVMSLVQQTARRSRLRQHLRRAHAGHRRVRRPHREALRARLQAARSQPGPERVVRRVEVPPASRERPAGRVVLTGRW